jgi:hypothetical protein
MSHRVLDPRLGLALSVLALAACDDKKTEAKPEGVSSAAPLASEKPSEPEPEGCKATGTDPVKLGEVLGYVYGFAGDATHLYTSSWQLYGSRGDLTQVRKDGGGIRNLTSLQLEPRGIAVSDKYVYFTAGIRLMTYPTAGGEPRVLAEKFSSQSIAGDGSYIYGVPGDYGPYDRLVRAAKADGKTKELDVSERPDSKHPPLGFSAIAVDSEGVYVTDSSGNRVLRFELDRAKPKVLAKGQEKAFDLAIDDDNVYFNLAQKGDLLEVSKKGGATKKLASGLVVSARLAADNSGLYTTLAGPSDDAPHFIVEVPKDGGEPKKLATVPKGHSIEGITLDDKCLYWAQRNPDTRNTIVYARARK